MLQSKESIDVLVDVNLDGHAKLIESRLKSDWHEFRENLALELHFSADVGLQRDSKDDFVWRFCQSEGYYLLTGNRRQESEDSLEPTIRREGKQHSLPVFTISDPEQIYRSAGYLNKVVEKLIEYLLFRQKY